MNFVDTHCHLYLKEFNSDIDKILDRAKTQFVNKYYLPAIDSEFHNDMIDLEKKFPKLFFPMMGLHPCSVKNNYKDELLIVEDWIQKRDFVAIGEIGLDFYWDKTFVKEQENAFNIQMQWALEKKWPIVIHSRNSIDECIEMVKPFSIKGLKGIFHCFSGNEKQAKEIIDLNFYLGIGGVLTYKNAGLKEVIEKIDLKYLVLETDAPYLAPVPYRGKRNESSYIKIIAEHLSNVKNISLKEVATITTSNTEKIFGA